MDNDVEINLELIFVFSFIYLITFSIYATKYNTQLQRLKKNKLASKSRKVVDINATLDRIKNIKQLLKRIKLRVIIFFSGYFMLYLSITAISSKCTRKDQFIAIGVYSIFLLLAGILFWLKGASTLPQFEYETKNTTQTKTMTRL